MTHDSSPPPSSPASPKWEELIDAAVDTCVDPSDIDVGHLAALARGEPLQAREASVTAHLDRCLHCQVQLRQLRALYAPGAMPAPPDFASFARDTREVPLPTPLPVRVFSAKVAAIAVAAAAAGVLVVAGLIPPSTPTAPLPGLEIVQAQGAIARTMGAKVPAAPDPDEAPALRYAPTGTVSLVVRLGQELPAEAAPAHIATFYADARARLRPIPAAHVTPTRSPGWISHRLRVPVGDVLGSQLGPRTLVTCVAYDPDALSALDGATLAEMDGAGRRCLRLPLEIATSAD